MCSSDVVSMGALRGLHRVIQRPIQYKWNALGGKFYFSYPVAILKVVGSYAAPQIPSNPTTRRLSCRLRALRHSKLPQCCQADRQA